MTKLTAWPELAPLLNDDEARVRQVAGRALSEAPDAVSNDEWARALTREGDSQAYWTLADGLKRRGGLTAELLMGSRHAPVGVRIYAAHFLADVDAPVDLRAWVAWALDEDPRVRNYAWAAFHRWKPNLAPATACDAIDAVERARSASSSNLRS